MSCYNPQFMRLVDRNGDDKYYEFAGKYRGDTIEPGVVIPCGHCLGCRLDYSRQWADRMMLELDACDGKGIFLTLTYDNEHNEKNIVFEGDLPICYTLDKRDWQLFIKKLRSRKEFENRSIRFYVAGEYGPTTQRNHLHCILFGVDLDDFQDLVYLKSNELGQPYYTSKYLVDIWQNGFITLSEVTWKTCAYVSRYVMKKAFHAADYENGLSLDNYRIPEFSLMSRRPGIGAPYMDKHPDWQEYTEYYVTGKEKSISMPKYFLKRLEKSDPVLYDKIKSDRVRFAQDRELLKLQQTDLSFEEQIELEYERKMKCVPLLCRDRVEKEGEIVNFSFA